MPAFGFPSSAEGGFPPAATPWISFAPLLPPAEYEYDTSYSFNPQTFTNPSPYRSDPPAAVDKHASFEPPYDSEQDYSSCFGQEELSETSSDHDADSRYSYGDEMHGFTVEQEDDYQHRGPGSYGYGYGYGDDDMDHCTGDKHDNRSAYVNPYALGLPTYDSLNAPGMHAHISNNGISAYSPSVPMPPPRFPAYPDTWSGLGTNSSVDPSGFWCPSFPLTWGAYGGTTTSLQSPQAYGATTLAQNHYEYGASTPMQGPYAYVGQPPWSTSDMNPLSWTQIVPGADSSHKQPVPAAGPELIHAQVHSTSIQGSSSNHIEGSQVADGEFQGAQFPARQAEKCHHEITTESISKASCSYEIKGDGVSVGGAQYLYAEPACSPLQSKNEKVQFKSSVNGGLNAAESSSKEAIIQGPDAEIAVDASSKDANISSECELLLVSIYNMSTLFTDKINKMDTNGGRLDVNMLESTIGLLSLCLSKQSENATKLRCHFSPQSQQSTQEQSSKLGVQPYPWATPDKDSAPSVEALLRALSHEKYAQIVEEAVEKSLKMHLEKALKNSADPLMLQQDFLQQCSKGNNALCSTLAEAQNVWSGSRFQISETDLEVRSLTNKLKEIGIVEEHGSSSVSGDVRGFDLNASLSSSHQLDGISDDACNKALEELMSFNKSSNALDVNGTLNFTSAQLCDQMVSAVPEGPSAKSEGQDGVSEILTLLKASTSVLNEISTTICEGKSHVPKDVEESVVTCDQMVSEVPEGPSGKSEEQVGVSELYTSLNGSKSVLDEILTTACEGESHGPKDAEESVVALDSDAEDWEYVVSSCSGKKGEL